MTSGPPGNQLPSSKMSTRRRVFLATCAIIANIAFFPSHWQPGFQFTRTGLVGVCLHVFATVGVLAAVAFPKLVDWGHPR
ncbi:MAG: hypothetical protein FD180_523 [Planctomycetota bacterium]|nr:MAG: hypothetical protein FD180_523 [Planctomycetota bacterium]